MMFKFRNFVTLSLPYRSLLSNVSVVFYKLGP